MSLASLPKKWSLQRAAICFDVSVFDCGRPSTMSLDTALAHSDKSISRYILYIYRVILFLALELISLFLLNLSRYDVKKILFVIFQSSSFQNITIGINLKKKRWSCAVKIKEIRKEKSINGTFYILEASSWETIKRRPSIIKFENKKIK